eukprot:GHVU01146379.1.p1 GENE.GHVU01146379.1~~GHVU01146379.1.p1  ORF type:complete len:110 (-),score=9.47 GHVU01146379.1:479-808(-)
MDGWMDGVGVHLCLLASGSRADGRTGLGAVSIGSEGVFQANSPPIFSTHIHLQTHTHTYTHTHPYILSLLQQQQQPWQRVVPVWRCIRTHVHSTTRIMGCADWDDRERA